MLQKVELYSAQVCVLLKKFHVNNFAHIIAILHSSKKEYKHIDI